MSEIVIDDTAASYSNNDHHDYESSAAASEGLPTIVLRVRRERRGAITATRRSSATLRVELDAALAAADDAFNEWDIHSNPSDDNDNNYPDSFGMLGSQAERDVTADNKHSKSRHRHRISVSSRSRQSINSSLTSSTSTAIFRRIESSSLLDESAMRPNSFAFNNNKRPRILDALLLADEDDDLDSTHVHEHTDELPNGRQSLNGGGSTSKKRRRLTLQILEPQQVGDEQRRRRSSLLLQYPILSPKQRAIDDSLQQVFVGTIALEQHCQFMYESTLLLAQTSVSDWYWPYIWSHADYGNWLHAAAIWNEASIVREVFHFLEDQFDQMLRLKSTISSRHTYTSLMREMIQSQNEEGLNPVQVAQLSSNYEVHVVLVHYSKMHNPDDEYINGNGIDHGDVHHEYDLYSLVVAKRDRNTYQDGSSDVTNDGEKFVDDDDDNDDNDPLLVTNCELHNDCRGYWDERGNLILETPSSATTATLNLDLDYRSKNHRTTDEDNLENDDDIDSNDEDWGGNDYPDDDDDIDFASDEGSDNEDYDDFRRRHVDVFRNNRRIVDRNDDYNDYDDDDAHYDPSYGDIYGQNDNLNR